MKAQDTMPNRHGHFAADGMTFVVTDPATPRAFDNFLWNDAIFACVQQTGVGTLDAQVDGLEGIKLYTGEGRICDIEVFGRDTLMSRLVYVRDRDTGRFWNVGWEPVRRPYESYACEHGLGFTRIASQTEGIAASLRLFVPPGAEPVELWRLAVKNAGGTPRRLSVFVYNQYLLQYRWGFNSYGDMLYRGAWFDPARNAMIVQKHPHVAPHAYLTAYLTADRPADGYDGSRDHFVGPYNTLAEPQAVRAGRCTDTPGSSEATVGVLQFDLDLDAGEEAVVRLASGLTDAPERLDALRPRLLDGQDALFEALRVQQSELVAWNAVTTPDEQFNRLANGWLKRQTLFGATWGRWGWMGYRDVVQHAWGVSSFDPARTRAVLLAAFAHQYRSGLALRGWNPPDTKSYSDSALWPVFALCDYLKETGDIDLLEARAPYHDGGDGTVGEHVAATMGWFEANKGAHDLCLIKYGDWNDSLTGIGKAGRGESVWLSLAYVHARRQLEALCRHLGRDAEAAEHAARADAVRDAVRRHAWDGAWYLRCFDDDGRSVGAASCEQGQIYVNAQSWAMLAGVADPAQVESMLRACDERLLTGQGYRLMAPPYLRRDDHIGRISYLEPGICENGTIYSHGNAFMMYALLREGLVDRAYDVFRRIAPGYMASEDDPKHAAPPYVFPNCYFAPEHRNRPLQAEFTWITGSVSWFLNAILDLLVGVRRDYDGLVVEPMLPSAWPELSVRRTFRGRQFDVKVRRTGTRTVTLNGVAVAGNRLRLADCREQNEVCVTL